MIRTHALPIAAGLFLFSIPALTAAPASAQVAPATVASYAAELRTINPKLPVDKARAYAKSVMADAWRTKLDPRFIMSIVTVESRWRSNAVSRVGARGLGQLMPGTAHTLGVNAGNAAENLRGTSSYLKTLMDHFAGRKNGVSLAIASYNAGPKAVEKYRGIPPYTETRNYVVRVLRVWKSLDSRIARTFGQAAPVAIAARTPEERQWVTDVDAVVPPATALPAAPAVTISNDPAK
ncbi:MAG TPA: lytic transglycosylase domain-containing protein [Candidatus Elarobacter sp.]|jgi:soluble lytic murein transglycosylase-like protein